MADPRAQWATALAVALLRHAAHAARLIGCILMLGALSLSAVAQGQGPRPLFGGFQTDSTDPIEVEAETLEVTEAGAVRQTRFAGNVVVRRGEMLIKAATLTIFSPADSAAGPGALGESSFDRIEAAGNVTVNSGEQTATGNEAVVDMKERVIRLMGNVVLTDGQNVLAGDRLSIDLDTGEARIESGGNGRIRGVFTPNQPAGQ